MYFFKASLGGKQGVEAERNPVRKDLGLGIGAGMRWTLSCRTW